jgi:hypothetical protein
VSSTAERLGLIAAVAVGLIVRVLPVMWAGSVVGDGGFILALVDDIRDVGDLPTVASYNQLDIPFAYPPAALLAAAGIGEVSGAETLTILRWLPLVLSVLCLVAFAWLARRALPPAAAIGATFAYALMPSAYGWLVAAGGLTRATGLLFALLAAGLVVRREPGLPSVRNAIAAGALLGLSGLAHPQAAVFGVVACVVLSYQRPARPWLARLGVAAITAAVVLLPWVVWVAATNGLGAIVAAGNRLEPGTGLIRMLNLRFSAAPFMDVPGILGALGLAACLLRRDVRLPILLLLTYLSAAGGGEFLAAVPWALLAGVGLAAIVELGSRWLASSTPAVARWTVLGVGSVALFLALIGSLGSVVDRSSKLHPMPAEQLESMRWLATNTPEETVVIVPTGEVWGFDEISEWLPALAQRYSLGTVQGSEWLGEAGFQAQLDNHERILDCANHTASCYADVNASATIYVPKGETAGPFSPGDCCPALRATLEDVGYDVVYDGPGATIAVPRD